MSNTRNTNLGRAHVGPKSRSNICGLLISTYRTVTLKLSAVWKLRAVSRVELYEKIYALYLYQMSGDFKNIKNIASCRFSVKWLTVYTLKYKYIHDAATKVVSNVTIDVLLIAICMYIFLYMYRNSLEYVLPANSVNCMYLRNHRRFKWYMKDPQESDDYIMEILLVVCCFVRFRVCMYR